MFKRLFWLVTGAGFGFGSSFWLQRAVRARVERYRPRRLSDELLADVRAAVEEGRAAMRQREAELRAASARPRALAAAGRAGPRRP